MLIDTHAHLDFPEFAPDLDVILQRAHDADVQRIITVGTSLEGSRRAIALAEQHPNIFAIIGVHPSNAMEVGENFITEFRELAKNPRVVALGEMGLDYHRLPSLEMHEAAVATQAFGNETQADLDASIANGAIKAAQSAVFDAQLDLAVELGLNVIVHERDAWDDTLALMQPYAGKLKAVFHCFGKSPDHLDQILALGWLVSFTGIVTFKNAELVQQSAVRVPAGSFMVETDCPYLAPVPFRGKRCEPAHVRETAAKIAALRNESLEDLARHTTETAHAIFRFPG